MFDTRIPYFVFSGCITLLLLDDNENTYKAWVCYTIFWFFDRLIILFNVPGTLIVVVDLSALDTEALCFPEDFWMMFKM